MILASQFVALFAAFPDTEIASDGSTSPALINTSFYAPEDSIATEKTVREASAVAGRG